MSLMVNTSKSSEPWIGKWLTSIVVGMPEESHLGKGIGIKKFTKVWKNHRSHSEK